MTRPSRFSIGWFIQSDLFVIERTKQGEVCAKVNMGW